MRNKILLLSAAAATLFSVNSFGQQISGMMVNQHVLTATDIAKLSQFGTQFGTARSTAMGGAFTSLGADLSSMHLNPAGLGMYQSSEFGFTPFITTSNITSTDPYFIQNGTNNKSRFSVANTGMAFNLYEGTGTLTSFTLGVGYNRLADFNTTNRMNLGNNGTTIGDIFVNQMEDPYYDNVDLGAGFTSRGMPYELWGASLAYKTYFIDPNDNPGYHYVISSLTGDAIINREVFINSKGSVGEWNVAGGFNFQNKLYFGFSIGIQDINYRQSVIHQENYSNNHPAFDYYARSLAYDQYSKIKGTGFNIKMGLTYRPVEPLRIALAVHTPTWASVTHTYSAGMIATFSDNRYKDSTPAEPYDYDYSTPARVLAGISYTFGRRGVLSVDYERTWYNSMRYRTDDYDREYVNSDIKGYFGPQNTLRAGAEFRPLDNVALRVGVNYSGTLIADKRLLLDSPVAYKNYGASGGLGFRLTRLTSLDFAYSYNQTKFDEYYLYQYTDSYDYFDGGNPTQTQKRHTVLATLGVRF